jgi:hypothetical protein
MAILINRLPIAKTSAWTSTERDATREMPRQILTLEQQLKGIRAAIRSVRTPPQLREGLLQREAALESLLEKTGSGKTKHQNSRSTRLFTL